MSLNLAKLHQYSIGCQVETGGEAGNLLESFSNFTSASHLKVSIE